MPTAPISWQNVFKPHASFRIADDLVNGNSAMSKERALTVSLMLVALAVYWLQRAPAGKATALSMCSSDQWVLDDAGVLACRQGADDNRVLPAAAALVFGRRLNLNAVSAEELALIPQIGPALSREIVSERSKRGRFKSWDDVDQIAGVGQSRLKILMEHCELGWVDGGV